ncbi:MAG: alkylation response protein AidB-like acyl-CoA dehydrogenase [Candidatus Aldehydirespiratoraceae bacterium]|jgi:alkylation response protein AidB-like acyl-CoA dehydrogenase
MNAPRSYRSKTLVSPFSNRHVLIRCGECVSTMIVRHRGAMASTGSMIELPGEDDPRRQELRDWFAEHPSPTPAQLRDRGLVVPHWPEPWGLDAEPVHQLIIEEEMKRAEAKKPINPIGTGHCGPVLVVHGTEAQKERYIPAMLTGEEMWCQLFSEPDAGSDLANLSTRAVRDGEEYIINGQKIWTSLADVAKFGILIARTDTEVSKHTGISYFIIDMETPGIEVRPILNMGGGGLFNEVFFNEVRVPVDNLIGEEHNGWAMAKQTLANERVSLSMGGLRWGHGPTVRDLVDEVRERGGLPYGPLKERLMRAYIEGEILRFHKLALVSAQINKQPGPDSSLRKAMADPHGKLVFELGVDLQEAAGMLFDGPLDGSQAQWNDGFRFSPALTVGGGTSEVLKNIIGERLLGLPHDHDVELGMTWTEAQKAQHS